MKILFVFGFIVSAVSSASISSEYQTDIELQIHQQLQQCIAKRQSQLRSAQLHSQECIRDYVLMQGMATKHTKDVETILKFMFGQICRNPQQIMKCLTPLERLVESCLGDSSKLLDDNQDNHGVNATFAYVCQDEGRKLAKLMADPMQMQCFSCVVDVVYKGECDISVISEIKSWNERCKKSEELLDCFADALRRRCEKHELLNYVQNLFHVMIKAGSCKHHLTKLLTSTPSPNLVEYIQKPIQRMVASINFAEQRARP